MSFISVGFFIFIIGTAIIYYILPKRIRWCILLLMSLSFYAISSIKGLMFVAFTVITSYIAALFMYKCDEKRIRKRWLIGCLICNFGILVFLKYCNFAITNFSLLMSVFNIDIPAKHVSLLMPMGISFYTFQTMSYVIDVYEKKYEPEKNIFKFALFVSFLPQMLQGPIGRFDRLAPQLFNGNDFELKNVEYGLQRIAWGLAKKLILADRSYVIANSIFSNLNVFSGVHIIVGLLTFSIYEYCDFSGGIDVVIGAAEIFGIKMDENFRQPYFSKSIGEFWRRWHITLGRWFREYVYIPLGGNRKGKARTIFNLFVVWSLTAVWHGAEGHFLIWGASLLLLLALEKAFLLQFLKKSKILSHVYLVLVVPLTWMAFAIADVGQLGVYYARMFPFFGVGETVRQMDFLQYLKDYGPLFLMGIVFSTPYPTALYKVFEKKWLGSLAVIVVLGLSLYYMAVSTNNPFLYFNF